MEKGQKPEIARVMNFESGETVQIFGENLDIDSKVYWWRSQYEDKAFADCGLPEGQALPELPPPDAEVYRVSEVFRNQVMYVSGIEKVVGGTAILWVRNRAGFSAPFLVNKPEIWSQSVRTIYPGGVVTVYGNGFWAPDHQHTVLKNAATGEFVPTAVLNPYESCYAHDSHRHSAHIRIPKEIADGEYEVYVHSGTAGCFGWSNPAQVTVRADYSLTEYYRTKWNRDTAEEISFPTAAVRAVPANPLGALADMTDEIQAAIDELAETGGTVALAAGIYGISRTINLRPGVVLLGAGKKATTIRAAYGHKLVTDWDDVYFAKRAFDQIRWAADWKPHYAKDKNAALIRIFDDAGIEELRLELGGGANIGVLLGNNCERSIHGAFLNYVDVDGGATNSYGNDYDYGAMSAGLLSVGSNDELTLFKSCFTAFMPVSILPGYNIGAKFIKNTFECSPRQMEQTYICGMRHSLFVENDFVGGRRSFMAQEGFDCNWVYQNRSIDVGRACNALEVYMSEYGECLWAGRADAVSDDSVTLNDAESKLGREDLFNAALREYPKFLCIIDGRGFGQYRCVSRLRNGCLTLDRSWDVMPDETTEFSLVTATWHNLWVDNSSAMSNGHSQFIWNSGIENVISGHYIDLAAGVRLYAWSCSKEREKTCVVAFNQILHCQVRASGKGAWLNADVNCDNKSAAVQRTHGLFGNSMRQNVFDGAGGVCYTKNLPFWRTTHNPCAGVAVGGAYNTVVNNFIGAYDVAVTMTDDCEGNCFEKNEYINVNTRFSGKGTPVGSDRLLEE